MKSEIYKHVYLLKKEGRNKWTACVSGFNQKTCSTEREAAVAADKMLINKGKPPVNILVKK